MLPGIAGGTWANAFQLAACAIAAVFSLIGITDFLRKRVGDRYGMTIAAVLVSAVVEVGNGAAFLRMAWHLARLVSALFAAQPMLLPCLAVALAVAVYCALTNGPLLDTRVADAAMVWACHIRCVDLRSEYVQAQDRYIGQLAVVNRANTCLQRFMNRKDDSEAAHAAWITASRERSVLLEYLAMRKDASDAFRVACNVMTTMPSSSIRLRRVMNGTKLVLSAYTTHGGLKDNVRSTDRLEVQHSQALSFATLMFCRLTAYSYAAAQSVAWVMCLLIEVNSLPSRTNSEPLSGPCRRHLILPLTCSLQSRMESHCIWRRCY
jgi:uncharacterized membrane protein